MKKPDLFFVREKDAIMLNMTVHFESKSGTLSEAALKKVSKYQDLTIQGQQSTGTDNVTYFGLPLSTTGKQPEENDGLLGALTITGSNQRNFA